ncbi:MAG: hypothetical protein QXT13_13325 [Pyrobaculum sp.]
MDKQCSEKYDELSRDVASTIGPIAYALGISKFNNMYVDFLKIIYTFIEIRNRYYSIKEYLNSNDFNKLRNGIYLNLIIINLATLGVGLLPFLGDDDFKACVNYYIDHLFNNDTHFKAMVLYMKKLLEKHKIE